MVFEFLSLVAQHAPPPQSIVEGLGAGTIIGIVGTAFGFFASLVWWFLKVALPAKDDAAKEEREAAALERKGEREADREQTKSLSDSFLGELRDTRVEHKEESRLFREVVERQAGEATSTQVNTAKVWFNLRNQLTEIQKL